MKVMLRAMWPSVNNIRKFNFLLRSLRSISQAIIQTSLFAATFPIFDNVSTSQSPPCILWDQYPRLHVLLPFLAHFAPSNLVPYSPNVSICSFTPCFSRSPLVHPFDVLLQVVFTDIVYPSSRHLFTVKSIVTPIAGITFFIWCIVKAKGVGPIIHQPSTLHGSDLGWGMVVSLMSCISNMATLVTYVLVLPFSGRETSGC